MGFRFIDYITSDNFEKGGDGFGSPGGSDGCLVLLVVLGGVLATGICGLLWIVTSIGV